MTEARCLWRERCDLMSGVVRLTVRGKVCECRQGRGRQGGGGDYSVWAPWYLGKGGDRGRFEDGKIFIRVALM